MDLLRHIFKKRLEEIREKEGGFKQNNPRWKGHVVMQQGNLKLINNADFDYMTDEEFVKTFEAVIRRHQETISA